MKEIFKNFTEKDFFKNVNLHIHSDFSDGSISFKTLILQAKKINLKYFSITDHNTIEGYKSLVTLPDSLIRGVEFDCIMDFNLPHILGYGIDIENTELINLCAEFKKGKFELINRIAASRDPKKVIETIHNANGIAVLAHPCCYWCLNLDKFVKKLVSFGLDGIEVYYPYNRITRILKFHSCKTVNEIANKYNLIKTGGKDNHGSLLEE